MNGIMELVLDEHWHQHPWPARKEIPEERIAESNGQRGLQWHAQLER